MKHADISRGERWDDPRDTSERACWQLPRPRAEPETLRPRYNLVVNTGCYTHHFHDGVNKTVLGASAGFSFSCNPTYIAALTTPPFIGYKFAHMHERQLTQKLASDTQCAFMSITLVPPVRPLRGTREKH